MKYLEIVVRPSSLYQHIIVVSNINENKSVQFLTALPIIVASVDVSNNVTCTANIKTNFMQIVAKLYLKI